MAIRDVTDGLVGLDRREEHNGTVTDDLEHTRGVRMSPPPELVEPPLPTLPKAPLAGRKQPATEDSAPVAQSRRPYRIKMADGVEVKLDLTVYLGRKPSVPRVARDRRVRLVTVPSAEKQVSATHLELRQSGDAVVATDMRSTNGSTVIIAGSSPKTLLRGESAVITVGTIIDLGEGNVLELLSPERLVAEVAPDTATE